MAENKQPELPKELFWIRNLSDEELALFTWSLEQYEPHKQRMLLKHVRENAQELLKHLRIEYGTRKLHWSIFEHDDEEDFA